MKKKKLKRYIKQLESVIIKMEFKIIELEKNHRKLESRVIHSVNSIHNILENTKI
jgi:hypothetical protein